MRSTTIRKSYARARLFRRAMLFIFFGIFIAVILWAIPWLPYGLAVEDYNNRLTLLMLMVFGACVSAFGAVYMRDLSDRMEQAVLTWSTVHDGLSDMRRREYFYDRIVAECERGLATGAQEFTVVALRLEKMPVDGDEVSALEKVIGDLGVIVKDNEFLAVLGPREFGVMALTVGASEAPAFAETLRSHLVRSSADASDVRVGWAVFPRDASDAGALVGMARERLWRVGSNRRNVEYPAAV